MSFLEKMEDALLKLEDVQKLIPVSKTTWYELIKNHEKLKPIKLGRGSFWKKSVILEFIDKLDSDS